MWPDKAQVHPSSSSLLEFQLFRPSIGPPYAPHTNADVRGDPLHAPHPTSRHTSNTRICLHTSAEVHRHDIRIPICTMGADSSASAASEIEVGSICPSRSFARPPRSTQIHVLLVWRGEGCGGWRGLPVRRHSYRGHRVELWRIADWLQNDKTNS